MLAPPSLPHQMNYPLLFSSCLMACCHPPQQPVLFSLLASFHHPHPRFSDMYLHIPSSRFLSRVGKIKFCYPSKLTVSVLALLIMLFNSFFYSLLYWQSISTSSLSLAPHSPFRLEIYWGRSHSFVSSSSITGSWSMTGTHRQVVQSSLASQGFCFPLQQTWSFNKKSEQSCSQTWILIIMHFFIFF